MIVETQIQKWGNGLALRISGSLRAIPNFKAGDSVVLDIIETGFRATKIKDKFSEEELLADMTPENSHSDLSINLLSSEYEY